MDPRLLQLYNQELSHVREMGGEFAREYPKIAARLGLDAFECADPYVERLLEGFAFLAARVQLKLDAEFPVFTQHLLQMVYPHYLAPTPSMAVVRFAPDMKEGSLVEGYTIPRGSALLGSMGGDGQTPCEYRTAHDVTLWPLEIGAAEYLGSVGAVTATGVPERRGVKAALRIRLRTTNGVALAKTGLASLPIFLRGGDELRMRLYEQLLANAVGVVVRPASRPAPWQDVLEPASIRRLGFDDAEALLPYGPQSYQGYRLLHEYFAFADRFMFVGFSGLGPSLRRCAESEFELVILLDRAVPALDGVLGAQNFDLFCTPAINLFPKRADRIHINERDEEFHLVPDRMRPMDFEVYEVKGVEGYGSGAEMRQTFLPFYAANDLSRFGDHRAYYAIQRQPRMLSAGQRQNGPRTSYIGSEVYLSLVDADEAPFSADLRQLAVDTLCTNRDLPLAMPVGRDQTDFTLQVSAPVQSVRCVAGPSRPKPAFAEGEMAWRLISHLSLNYLSLTDTDARQGAAALREILTLYADTGEAPVRKQVEGVRSVAASPVIRRLDGGGPAAVARGLEVTVTLDESSFEGTGEFLLGAVLEQFFARYASVNSFTETVIRTVDRGETMRWTARPGRRSVL